MHSWIKYCVKKARERQTTQRFRLHAILVKDGSLQVEGCNQSVEEAHARVVHPNAPEWMGVHAEMDCLRRATPSQIDGSVMYIGGVKYNGDVITTKPCEWCMGVLVETNIKKLCSSVSEGSDHYRRL